MWHSGRGKWILHKRRNKEVFVLTEEHRVKFSQDLASAVAQRQQGARYHNLRAQFSHPVCLISKAPMATLLFPEHGTPVPPMPTVSVTLLTKVYQALAPKKRKGRDFNHAPAISVVDALCAGQFTNPDGSLNVSMLWAHVNLLKNQQGRAVLKTEPSIKPELENSTGSKDADACFSSSVCLDALKKPCGCVVFKRDNFQEVSSLLRDLSRLLLQAFAASAEFSEKEHRELTQFLKETIKKTKNRVKRYQSRYGVIL